MDLKANNDDFFDNGQVFCRHKSLVQIRNGLQKFKHSTLLGLTLINVIVSQG